MSDTPNRPFFQFSLRSAIVLILLMAVFIGLAINVVKKLGKENKQAIRFVNAAGSSIKNVSVTWTSVDGARSDTRKNEIVSEDSAVELPAENHVSVQIKYTLQDKALLYSLSYVEIWPGEIYTFRLQPDGTIDHNYQSNLNRK